MTEPAPVANGEGATGRTGRLRSFVAAVSDAYGTADPRSLGLFRIALGALLFVDVARRWPDLDVFYTNAGWLPNHYALFRPMSGHLFSVHLAFDTPLSVKVLTVFHLLVNAALLVGYRTKTAQVLAAVLITSMNSRNILIENGGWVVLNLLAVWTVFLPLGRRFGVDAWRRRWSLRVEATVTELGDRSWPAADVAPVRSLAVAALIAQFAVIYAFNVIHKTGPAWRDGTAVYYFFEQDRMVTAFGAWVRGVVPLDAIRFMTWSTLAVEALIAVLLIVPFARRWARLAAFALAVGLHGAIDAVVQLGPFSWAMMIVHLALVPRESWVAVARWAERRVPSSVLAIDEDSARARVVARSVKRLDAFGKVEIVGLAAERDGRESMEVRPDARGAAMTPSEGLARLARSLGLPRACAAVLGWAAVRAAVRGVVGLVTAWSEPQARATAEAGPRAAAGPPEPTGASRAAERFRKIFSTSGVVVLLVACGSQVLVENRAVPDVLRPSRRPPWMEAVVVYPRLFQGWSMFAPSPPMDDGRVVVDGRTADGRRLDPLTGKEPSWEVQPRGGFRMNQIWGDFHRRIGEPRFSHLLPGVRDMLREWHVARTNAGSALVAFDVWLVTEHVPPPGVPRALPQRRKLVSHGSVADPMPFHGSGAP